MCIVHKLFLPFFGNVRFAYTAGTLPRREQSGCSQNPVGFPHQASRIYRELVGTVVAFTIDLIYVRLATRYADARQRAVSTGMRPGSHNTILQNQTANQLTVQAAAGKPRKSSPSVFRRNITIGGREMAGPLGFITTHSFPSVSPVKKSSYDAASTETCWS